MEALDRGQSILVIFNTIVINHNFIIISLIWGGEAFLEEKTLELQRVGKNLLSEGVKTGV